VNRGLVGHKSSQEVDKLDKPDIPRYFAEEAEEGAPSP
jgi:hypothetical protein